MTDNDATAPVGVEYRLDEDLTLWKSERGVWERIEGFDAVRSDPVSVEVEPDWLIVKEAIENDIPKPEKMFDNLPQEDICTWNKCVSCEEVGEFPLSYPDSDCICDPCRCKGIENLMKDLKERIVVTDCGTYPGVSTLPVPPKGADTHWVGSSAVEASTPINLCGLCGCELTNSKTCEYCGTQVGKVDSEHENLPKGLFPLWVSKSEQDYLGYCTNCKKNQVIAKSSNIIGGGSLYACDTCGMMYEEKQSSSMKEPEPLSAQIPEESSHVPSGNWVIGFCSRCRKDQLVSKVPSQLGSGFNYICATCGEYCEPYKVNQSLPSNTQVEVKNLPKGLEKLEGSVLGGYFGFCWQCRVSRNFIAKPSMVSSDDFFICHTCHNVYKEPESSSLMNKAIKAVSNEMAHSAVPGIGFIPVK